MRYEREIIDAAMNRRIELEDSICYGCTECGRCCREIHIMLNAYDLYRLAKNFKVSMFDFIQQYCECYRGNDSNLPVVAIKMQDGCCPFLKDNKCSVQSVKPFVCASYPIGRGYDEGNEQVFYFFQDVTCGFPYRKLTVKEWIYGDCDVAYEEEVYKLWNRMIISAAKFVNRFSEDFKRTLCGMFFEIFYCGYSTEKDFLMQLKEIVGETEKLIKEASDLYEAAHGQAADDDSLQ